MVKNYSRKVYAAAFAAMMVATGVSAFADANEVALSNGLKISWSDFVDGVNDPTTVTGELPESDPAYAAVKAAENVVKEKEAVIAEDTKETEGSLLYNQAQAAATLETKQGELTTAEGDLTKAQQDLTKLTTQQGNLNSQLTTANSDLTQLSNQLNNLEKVTTTNTVDWLDKIYTAAETFETNYDTKEDGDGEIYYKYTEDYDDIDEEYQVVLTVAYTKPDDSSFKGPLTQSQYRSLLTTTASEGVDGLKGKNVATLYVYLGPDYAETVTSKSKTLKVGAFTGKLGNIVTSSVGAIRTLTNNAKYQTSTTTYKDQEAAEAIQKNIDDTNATIASIKLQLNGGTDAEGNQVEGVVNQLGSTQETIDTLNNTTIPAAKEAVNEAQTAKDTADAAVKAAEDAVTLAQNDLASAEAALKTAQDNANATARDAYNDITLLGDVTVDTPIASTYTGTIDGDNHIITVANADGYAFRTFSGNLANAAVNGKFGERLNGASFSNVVAWRGVGQTNTFYPEVGNATTYASLGALGYAVRNDYGVDFATSELVTLSEETTVYNITVNKSADVNTQAYVVNKGGKLIGNNNQEVAIPANTFAKSEDEFAFNNVYYLDGGNYVCSNAVITDKVNFYCPENITAANVEYTREFSEGLNAVTLPFEVSKDNFAEGNVLALSTFDRETPEKFYFTIQESNPIAANTPMLLVGAEGAGKFTFDNLENVAISKTSKNIVEFEGATDDPAKVYGNYVKATRSEMAGESQGFKVYGLSGGKFVVAGETATFAPFRMAVSSALVASQSEAQKAPRSIAFLDEKGVEIGDLLTGIGSVVADEEETAFDIVAGQGEIIFTSDSDFGKVEIYTLDGKVAAAANVTEGTTAVSLQKGLYIVMGKKLVVK